MPTAQQITDGALSKIGVARDGSAPDVQMTADAIVAMNALLDEWASSGISFGASQATLATDETSIPGWARQAVEFELGLRIASDYDASITQTYALALDRSYRGLLNRLITTPEVAAHPNTPLGAGNRYSGYWQPRFVGEAGANDITTETGVTITDEHHCEFYFSEDVCP